jgi:hypothetical protein
VNCSFSSDVEKSPYNVAAELIDLQNGSELKEQPLFYDMSILWDPCMILSIAI